MVDHVLNKEMLSFLFFYAGTAYRHLKNRQFVIQHSVTAKIDSLFIGFIYPRKNSSDHSSSDHSSSDHSSPLDMVFKDGN